METYYIYDSNGNFVELLEAESEDEVRSYLAGLDGWTFDLGDE